MSEHKVSDSEAGDGTGAQLQTEATRTDAHADPAGDDGMSSEAGRPEMRSTDGSSGSSPGRSIHGLIALLALLIAAAAVAGTGFLWWQYRQFYVTLDGADSQQRATLEALVLQQSEVDRVIDGLGQELAQDRNRIIDLRTTISDFPQQIGALDQRLDALQGRSLDAREVWLRAEAEYYLVVANTEISLSGRVERAITALTLADGLLRELGDPALNPVRVAIADELTALRAVPLVDHDGLAFSLASLASRVAELPFRAAGTTRFDDSGPELDAVEPGVGRLWESLKQALLGVVRIERRDVPVDVLLSAGERDIVRRQVVLELQLSRIALLRGEAEAFRASLMAAAALLTAEFDTGAAGVTGVLDLIGELERLDIAPDLPDLTGSLGLLRGAAAGGGG